MALTNVDLLLGEDVSGALFGFAGLPAAAGSELAHQLVRAALRFAAQQPDLVAGQLYELPMVSRGSALPDVFGHGPGPAATAVAEHIADLLTAVAPGQLRELGVVLAVTREAVAAAMQSAAEAGSPAPAPPEVSSALDALAVESAREWVPAQRDALSVALVWEVGALVALGADLGRRRRLPRPVLWQAVGTGHACAGIRVPGAASLVWARTRADQAADQPPPLWQQAHPSIPWGWSVGWHDTEGRFLTYTAGRTPSLPLARWRAQWALDQVQHNPAAIRHLNGTRLITSRHTNPTPDLADRPG